MSKRREGEFKMEETAKAADMFISEAIPLSVVKRDFSKYNRLAQLGLEILVVNKHAKTATTSLVDSDVLSVLMDGLRFSIIETDGEELGGMTIAVDELPVYGEGDTREEAVADLLEAVVDYCNVYTDNIEMYRQVEGPRQRALMLKLLRCKDNKERLRQTLKV